MIELDKVTIRSGEFILRDVSLAIAKGQYGVLMGRTGCGKTTLLEAICGLRPVEAGRILLNGRDVTRLRPAERGIGYVPQDSALFATMKVRDQLAYALSLRQWDGTKVVERVANLVDLLEIGSLIDRYPQGLSGGETRRVALGRALASYPSTLLLDEPLSGLDDATRDKLIELLKHVQRSTGVTLLHVTHSNEDATRLADCRFTVEGGLIRSD